MSTKILFFLNFLIPLPHFGQLSGGALWWWFPELIFFFGPLPSLLPFAPLFHIVTPQWRPLVVDPGTNFFCALPSLLPLHPYFISSRHGGALWWWIPELIFFFVALPSLLPLHPYFISSRHGGALWWWIPELNFFWRTSILTPFCNPISYRHATVAPSGGGFRN